MNLNYVLSWIVGTSATLSLLVYMWRFGLQHRGWLGIFSALLLLLGIGTWAWPQYQGYIAATAWIPAVLLPMRMMRRASLCSANGNFDDAMRWAKRASVLHPWDKWPARARHFEVMRLLPRGGDAVARKIEALAADDPRAARELQQVATLQRLRSEGAWGEILEWVEQHAGLESGKLDPTIAMAQARALGELGKTQQLLSACIDAEKTASKAPMRHAMRLLAAAYTGRMDLVQRILATANPPYPASVMGFWKGTAKQCAGRSLEAQTIFESLMDVPPESAASADRGPMNPMMRQRLSAPLAVWDRHGEHEDTRKYFAVVERESAAEARFGVAGRATKGFPWVTAICVAVNAAAFTLEIAGGPESASNLVRLGALVLPQEHPDFAWWRIWTAGFLHLGWLHLTLNLVGLYFLGRYVERVWGRIHVVLVYLVATIGANFVALWVTSASMKAPMMMVGASSGVMGLLGAVLVLTALAWRQHGAAIIRRHAAAFLGVLVLQLLFDAFTPAISSTLHLGGLLIGALLAPLLHFAHRR